MCTEHFVPGSKSKITMCKHKSGGMSRPSGATAEQPSLHSSMAIACSGHSNVPVHCTAISTTSPQCSVSGHQTQASKEQQNELALTPSKLQNFAAGNRDYEPWSRAQADKARVFSKSSCPPLQTGEPENQDVPARDDDEEDDDEITELSPFLFNKPFAICWQNSLNVRNAKKYERVCNVRRNAYEDCRFQNAVDRDLPSDKYSDFRARCERTSDDLVCDEHRSSSSHLHLGYTCSNDASNCSSHTDDDCDDAPSVESNSSCSYSTPTYASSIVNTDPVPGPSGVMPRRNSIHVEIDTGDSDKDDEFRGRSYSLTPTVNFAVFESESASEADDDNDSDVFLPPPAEETKPKEEQSVNGVDDQIQIPVSSFNKIFHISPSAAQLSIASSYGDGSASICKICHMTAKENDPLISPCRCSGTMQYIHCGCLMRWLEISSKRSRKPASCELCQYQYHWHKKFKVRHWQFPHCSRRDKILHFLFFLSIFVMVACAIITIMCFKQDKGTKVNPDRTELTQSEIVTLVCGVTFFLAFFVAMYVEVKSHSTIYKLLVKFIYLNQQWYIDEYEKKDSAPVPV